MPKITGVDLSAAMLAHRSPETSGRPDTIYISVFGSGVAQVTLYLTPAQVVQFASEMLTDEERALIRPAADPEGHALVLCDECGLNALDDNTDACINPVCASNIRIREKLAALASEG